MLRIFTEGKDKKFIEILLVNLGYKVDEHFTVDSTGGWQKLELVKPKIQDFKDQNDGIVIVFDADDQLNNGGYEKRLEEIKSIVDSMNLDDQIFLFPNNQDDGDYETLLTSIVVPKRVGVFDCFRQYELCIEKLSNEETVFRTPLKKSKIYAYFESMDKSSELKQKQMKIGNLFFEDNDYWDLNSEDLNSLKQFLVSRLPNI